MVKAFTNRWPSFPDDRCEVVLYAPDHDARLPDLPLDHVRLVVDLWAERTAALGSRPDLAYVLVFENHGEAVGATIAHPHGQIYAYPDVPALPATELARLADGHRLLEDDRPELDRDRARRLAGVGAVGADLPVRHAGRAARARAPTCPSLDDDERDRVRLGVRRGAAPARGRVRPADAVHVLDPPAALRRRRLAAGVDARRDRRPAPGARACMRYVAGAELGSGAYLNPVAPEDAAANLRAVDAVTADHRRRARAGST